MNLCLKRLWWDLPYPSALFSVCPPRFFMSFQENFPPLLVLLYNHSTVVSKTPGLKTRKQKPGGREVAVQLLWTVWYRTQPPFSCCCLKSSPGHMSYSPFQTNKSDQLAASRQVKPVNLSPSSIFKVYAKLNLRTDSCHGEKPNNTLNARCLVLICFKTDTFRKPTLATSCKY